MKENKRMRRVKGSASRREVKIRNIKCRIRRRGSGSKKKEEEEE